MSHDAYIQSRGKNTHCFLKIFICLRKSLFPSWYLHNEQNLWQSAKLTIGYMTVRLNGNPESRLSPREGGKAQICQQPLHLMQFITQIITLFSGKILLPHPTSFKLEKIQPDSNQPTMWPCRKKEKGHLLLDDVVG